MATLTEAAKRKAATRWVEENVPASQLPGEVTQIDEVGFTYEAGDGSSENTEHTKEWDSESALYWLFLSRSEVRRG